MPNLLVHGSGRVLRGRPGIPTRKCQTPRDVSSPWRPTIMLMHFDRGYPTTPMTVPWKTVNMYGTNLLWALVYWIQTDNGHPSTLNLTLALRRPFVQGLEAKISRTQIRVLTQWCFFTNLWNPGQKARYRRARTLTHAAMECLIKKEKKQYFQTWRWSVVPNESSRDFGPCDRFYFIFILLALPWRNKEKNKLKIYKYWKYKDNNTPIVT